MRDVLLYLILVQVLAGFIGLLIIARAMWLLWPRANGRCRLDSAQNDTEDLDINTAPEFQGKLPNDRLPQLLHEFVRFADQILKQGDIP